MKTSGKKMLLFLCLLPFVGQTQKISYTIDGKTTNRGARMAILLYRNQEKTEVDSAFIKNGSFRFTGTVSQPQLASVTLADSVITLPLKSEPVLIALESGKITFRETDGSVKINGGTTNRELKAWKQMLTDTGQTWNESDPKSYGILNAFAEKYPGSYICLSLIKDFQACSPIKADSIFRKLDPNIRNSEIGKSIERKYQLVNALTPGKPAPGFSLNDPDGNPHQLSDFRGNYVLLDFWASWCKPCREVNKHLIPLAEKYKDRNLKIVGISMDSGKQPWQKAIADDGVTWLQLSELTGMAKSKVAELYQVGILPASFLIDPKGNLIKVDKGMHEMIASIFEKSR